MTKNDSTTLYILGDHHLTVDGAANDVRGRRVEDKLGETIGRVTDLVVDEEEVKIRFLIVEHGGFLGLGHKTSLIPVEAVTQITERVVSVNQTRAHVAAAPGYSPELVDDRPLHADIYEHYGCRPHWEADYLSPGIVFPPMTAPH